MPCPSHGVLGTASIGVYATCVLQPTTPVAHLTRGLAIYAYLPMTHAASHNRHRRTGISSPTPQANPPSRPSPGGPPYS